MLPHGSDQSEENTNATVYSDVIDVGDAVVRNVVSSAVDGISDSSGDLVAPFV